MKRIVMCVIYLTLMTVPVLSEEKKIELQTPKEKLSYSIGFDIGSNLKRGGIAVDPYISTRAIQDALSGGRP